MRVRSCEGEVVWVCLSAVGGQTASRSTGEEGAGGGVETKSELLYHTCVCVCVWGGLAMSCTYNYLQYFFSEEEGVWHYKDRLHTRVAKKQE